MEIYGETSNCKGVQTVRKVILPTQENALSRWHGENTIIKLTQTSSWRPDVPNDMH